MILACQKLLGQVTKVLGLRGPPPPLCWEKFPNNSVFFFWCLPLRCYGTNQNHMQLKRSIITSSYQCNVQPIFSPHTQLAAKAKKMFGWQMEDSTGCLAGEYWLPLPKEQHPWLLSAERWDTVVSVNIGLTTTYQNNISRKNQCYFIFFLQTGRLRSEAGCRAYACQCQVQIYCSR